MKEFRLRVVELFAGVGGFRIGLERSNFKVVWSNQSEPRTKTQHASNVYEARFGKENHSNVDIAKVPTSEIPDHDLLCGGFPCQDYSVATTLHNSKGLKGKKGILWWSIHRILSEKKQKPSYLFLENVDRLLKSPAKQRGRDFAVMLQSLNELGYTVEWRVVNAADYGMPQRRKRVFFIGYHRTTDIYGKIKNAKPIDWIDTKGVFANAFPMYDIDNIQEFGLVGSLAKISTTFNIRQKLSPFLNAGLMIDGVVYTSKTLPKYSGKRVLLKDILVKGKVPDEFYVKDSDKEKWNFLKGAKKLERISKSGHIYNYSEGAMIYPDSLEKPSRTIITGEGGKSPSRFKHVVNTPEGLRRLIPLELERLCMFPDNHTKLEGITDTKRAFLLGNSLVVGVIEAIGKSLAKLIKNVEE